MALAVTEETLAASRRGTPLRLSGVVRSEDCRPLAGATLHAWHTNGDGVYGPPDEGGGVRCCYLQGTLLTDTEGRYRMETVMPGMYGGRPHIHVELSHPRARGILTELQFGGSSAPTVIATVGGSLEAGYDFVLAGR